MMKAGRILSVAFWVATGAVLADEPVCPLGSDWVLDATVSDEFNGTGIDKAKWWDYAPRWRGRREFLYSHKNVEVRDGFLSLYARNVNPEEMAYEDREDGILPYTCAIIKSRKKVTYGYFECRARGNAAEVRNAFWLYDPLSDRLSKKVRPGSHSEEIDIYEFIGKYQDPSCLPYEICAHVHRFETPYVEGLVNHVKTKLANPGGAVAVDWAPCDGYHLYGFLWTEKEMVWYVDGKEYFRRDNDYFHTPLHVMFDCEIATWRRASVKRLDPATLPASHSVDWFRRWVKRVPGR
ncbi:MAG TPA: family 16 glycosylhydrolase [Kiritimatiellia bacterium]|jgi:beta-glucanase (GH16 family)|nr:family 16 glycosylhydrolase [Kiritimatiellia bacterium]HOM58265.1 family 16 glycosylhydrolase [Kiritimatiellia bacterium]HOR97456.1 family 16 glycosylhydrolase [Kiritimatiellia bacterium]HPC49188.1 family 16 glycosylhydrolase [Kiritimatiellia bacterium]HPK37124.1 family 16 glycosylhydrolase [Kiritimatiellia bacterium]